MEIARLPKMLVRLEELAERQRIGVQL